MSTTKRSDGPEQTVHGASDAEVETPVSGETAFSAAQQRRRRLVEEASLNNPFIANMKASGGNVGPAEAAIQRYIADGNLDDLPGKGQPLPEEPPPPFSDGFEEKMKRIVDKMLDEKQTLKPGEWRAAVAKSAALPDKKANTLSKTGVR
eukprot:CAMPEP_0172660598 /NCGR_PEP_ID=MMETSP1074-20121228/4153_1 /TAXON_ID=2916 /ORGANISM="Ceratium fusus, Strain PA161109" /LENGTH=148 /DNA_ID=CAMNT_0013476229 /DNA_START=185 /DNA_END=631 /DNA_ORIENTATION=+